jgi:ribonuclease HI
MILFCECNKQWRKHFFTNLLNKLQKVKQYAFDSSDISFNNHVIDTIKTYINNNIITHDNAKNFWLIILNADTWDKNKTPHFIKNNKKRFTIFQQFLFKGITRWLHLTKQWARKDIELPYCTIPKLILKPGSCNLNISNSNKRTKQEKLQAKNNFLFYETKLPKNCIQIWTDGSLKNNNDICGCGIFIIFPNKMKLKIYYKIRGDISFGETTAITISLLILQKMKNNLPIFVFTDSENAYNSCFNHIKNNTSHPTIKNFLKKQIYYTNTHIIKISSHCNIINNDIVDEMANKAIQITNIANFNSLTEIRQSIIYKFEQYYNNKLTKNKNSSEPDLFPDKNTIIFNDEEIAPIPLNNNGYYYFECNNHSSQERTGIG